MNPRDLLLRQATAALAHLEKTEGRAELAVLPPDGANINPLIQQVLDGPSSGDGLTNLLRVLEAVGDEGWPTEELPARPFALLLSCGPDLTDTLVREPALLLRLARYDLGETWTRRKLRAELAQSLSAADALIGGERAARALREFRNAHYVRLALREFADVSLETVTLELTKLADVCLDVALECAVAIEAERYGEPVVSDNRALTGGRRCAVTGIAMGKFGAEELNFCSDIDVIFAYESDEGRAGDRSLHEFFSAVCQRTVQLLAEPQENGFCFRVDLRLRPEGARGPICNSLAGVLCYYESWGSFYDRLAWIKARPSAGALALGQDLVRHLQPFVFPRAAGADVLAAIGDLTQRIRHEGARLATKRRAGWDVKTGEGGIRDIEFFVQALQLIYGGKDPSLRSLATLSSLRRLAIAGLITEDEHRKLDDAYDLLRRIEHRLQLAGGRQTHWLANASDVRSALASHLGYATDAFENELEMRRYEVTQIYRTLHQGSTEHDEGTEGYWKLISEPAEDSLVETLASLGFEQPSWVAEELRHAVEKPWGPFSKGSNANQHRVATMLLDAVVASPNPDEAFRQLSELMRRYGQFRGLWDLLGQSAPLIRQLCNLFGSSELLSEVFLEHPELIDRLLLREHGEGEAARRKAELVGTLRDIADIEDALEVVDAYRNEEILRIGMHDLAGEISPEVVSLELSDVAEVTVAQLAALIRKDMEQSYGIPRSVDGQPSGMSVVALGKLGSRELSYGSDLDLIFLFGSQGVTDGKRSIANSEYFSRMAQRLVRALSRTFAHGSLYRVDTRLRPSGSQGSLVVSLQSFKDYHHSEAQTWERQVLLKARHIAGDEAMWAELEPWLHDYVYRSDVDAGALRSRISELRKRIEQERTEGEEGPDIKHGPGGILDVEFCVQYLQLVEGRHCVPLQSRSTVPALRAAVAAGFVSAADGTELEDGYIFLRRIESRQQIARGQSNPKLQRHSRDLDILARRLGYRHRSGRSPGDQLFYDYSRSAAAIRAVYRRVMGPFA